MAGVAKWLRQWVVIPPFAGSSPVTRPILRFYFKVKKKIKVKITNISMSRYRGPKLRIVRRLGTLPGLTQKKSKKKDRPGQHGKSNDSNTKKTTEYGLRLEEKQKLKFNYGLTEHQLYRYIKEARRRQRPFGDADQKKQQEAEKKKQKAGSRHGRNHSRNYSPDGV